jgi:AsmA family protein
LPTRLNISGTFRRPDVTLGRKPSPRAGAVAGLGVLFGPLALLPTVQFGTSAEEDARCGGLGLMAPHCRSGSNQPVRACQLPLIA